MKPLATIAFVALAAAGCASAPDRGAGDGLAPLVVAPGLDPAAKFALPRIRGKVARAIPAGDFLRLAESDESGPPTNAKILRAHAQREAIVRETLSAGREKAAGVRPSAWQSLGPSNVAGRVRAIAIDPRNAQRIFVGAATGGIWLSEDRGATWRAIQDFLPNLSASTIVFDPANPNVMYAGTGEQSTAHVGLGVMKSVNGGLGWTLIPATNPDLNADWRYVNRLAIHPTQTQVLIAAVTNLNRSLGGIYRSADGAATWTRASTLGAHDVAFDPNNPSNAVAGLDNGAVAYSRDAGASWTQSAALVASPGTAATPARIEIAYARAQPGLVYASVDAEEGEVWGSLDGGVTWEKRSNPGHLQAQGFYDNAIWVDPADANHVVVGGIDLHRSRDGGRTFSAISDWRLQPSSPHADHHALVSVPGTRTLYSGNDGGVYRTDNIDLATASAAGGWTAVNTGLAITQFYSGAGRTSAGARVIGGTQDNGSLVLDATQWRPFFGGDGGFVAVDPASDTVLYGEYVYLSIFRSSGPGSRTFICNGITEGFPDESGGLAYCGASATKEANFIAPFVLDPSNPNRMLAGANSLWVSDNVRSLSPAPAWRAIKSPIPSTGNYINAIAVAEGNGAIVYAGHNGGEVYRSTDALAATPSWVRVGTGTLPARQVQRILVDKDNHNRVIVAYGGFVANNLWQSLDGGATWASITGNLPATTMFDIKRHPANPSWLYLATSVGIFTSENGGASWSTSNEGPANIRVRELFWLDDATLGAATFGRGMFKASVPAGGPASYQDLWWAGAQENGWGMSITQHGNILFAALFIYDAQGQPMWVVLPGGTWNAGFTEYTGALYYPSGSWYGAYDASRFNANAPVGSATLAFSGTNSATLTYTINGVSGTKSIQRQPFGPADATPSGSYGDLWWGGAAQNGWGVAINQQYRTIFAVWYTYDTAGKPVWYVVPSGSWTTASTYSGSAFRTTGSAWIGATYNPAALALIPAGSVNFTFSDIGNGVMSYNVDGVSQSKPIARQPF